MPNPLASPRGGGGPLEIVARDSRGETMSYIMRIIHLPRRAQRAEPCVHAAKHTETKGNAVESHGKTSGERPERPVGKVGNGRCLSLSPGPNSGRSPRSRSPGQLAKAGSEHAWWLSRCVPFALCAV